MNYSIENYIASLSEFNKIVSGMKEPAKQNGTVTKRGESIVIIPPASSDVKKITIKDFWKGFATLESGERVELDVSDLSTIKTAYQI